MDPISDILCTSKNVRMRHSITLGGEEVWAQGILSTKKRTDKASDLNGFNVFTLIKAQCPRVSAEDYELGVQTSSETESQKESCRSLDQIHVHCRKENKTVAISWLSKTFTR